jgi:hypothetical protein
VKSRKRGERVVARAARRDGVSEGAGSHDLEGLVQSDGDCCGFYVSSIAK